jgi:hypothetical protein
MTKRVTSEIPYFKVRIVMPNVILHVASRDEPKLAFAPMTAESVLDEVRTDWIQDDPDAGDTIGFIDWTQVTAITWRSTRDTSPS